MSHDLVPAGLTLERVATEDLEFAYLTDPRAAPDAPLAVLLHGFPDTAITWRYLIPQLTEAGFRPVAPWLRGYAPTQVPADGLYQMGAVARDANRLHQALGGDGRAVIVGHDWGASATYVTIATAPDRWSRAVTMAVPPPAAIGRGFGAYEQLRRSWYMFFFQSPLADLVVPADDLAFIDRLWADWSPGYDPAAELPAVKAALRDPANLAAALGYYRASLGEGPRTEELNAAQAAAQGAPPVPLLYLHGAGDGCIGVRLTDGVSDDLAATPGSRVEIVQGIGHFLHLEAPQEVNRLIVDFLAGDSR